MSEMANVRTKTRSPLAKFFPIIGALLAISMAVLAFRSSDYVDGLAEDRAGARYPPPVLQGEFEAGPLGEVTFAQLAITVALWLVYMVAAWMLVAMLAKITEPNKKAKKQLKITDKGLKSERKGIDAEKARRKKKRKKLQRKAFQESKEKGQNLF